MIAQEPDWKTRRGEQELGDQVGGSVQRARHQRQADSGDWHTGEHSVFIKEIVDEKVSDKVIGVHVRWSVSSESIGFVLV
jgi:hypothetical protein